MPPKAPAAQAQAAQHGVASSAASTTSRAQGKEAAAGGAAGRRPSGRSWLSIGSNFVVGGICLYAVVVANGFRTILWPNFDVDPSTPVHRNVFGEGDTLRARLWVDKVAFPTDTAALAEFDFAYQWQEFKTVSTKVNASITQKQLTKNRNLILSTEVVHQQSGRVVRAKGALVKSVSPPQLAPKYHLPTGALCPVAPEPAFGKKDHVGKGIPKMEVRLVFDTTAYPFPYARSPWTPPIFVDEFWMTNDQLVKLNTSGSNSWESEVHFNLMGVARWRFQRHMEQALQQTSHLLGEDSEEALQMRDLFANTHPYLLAATLIVSVLEILFQFLAFKNDVEFFQGIDPETLTKYVSIQSIVAGVFMQLVLTVYLWDESANILVLASSAVSILIDVWKIFRAMRLEWTRWFGFLPVPSLVLRAQRQKQDDYDTQAMKWLSLLCMPGILGYAGYSLAYDCHKSWYSYVLFVCASCTYGLGFILMTPQLFINYKHKTVAYLPWRKFVYRALTTFIDDLFAMIVRMPTMHRLSCFRDDVVFLIYLYQRRIYSVDRTRVFDEEGYELSAEEVAAIGGSGPTEPKKDK